MEVKKVYLTNENLIEIEKVDISFYKDDVPGIEWYLQRYNSKHYAYCLIEENKIVGYIVSVPVKKELYDAIINGVLLNDWHINPDMYMNQSEYNYIVSCVIKEEYRNKGYGKLLMETLMEELKGNICCLTISKDGYNLASKYMTLRKTLNESVSVFTKTNN